MFRHVFVDVVVRGFFRDFQQFSDQIVLRIQAYIRPDADLTDDWRNVPDEIRDTFDKLGIVTVKVGDRELELVTLP